MSFETPLLLIFWKRADLAVRIIDALRPFSPSRLFLASDGGRDEVPQEMELVARARQQVEGAIDWPCAIERRYSPINQGCKFGPANAIDWFFSRVEEGIILEDDCLPHPDFLPLCRALLQRFRDDERVWCITGTNFQAGTRRGEGSYYFSRYAVTWGWATWRRCWRQCDLKLEQWPLLRHSGELAHVFADQEELEYWKAIWDRLLQEEHPSAWDYQWNFTCFLNGALAATANTNLISNIGFGQAGTHCLDREHPFANLATAPLGPLRHPVALVADREADRHLFRTVYRDGGQPRPPARGFRRLRLRLWFTLRGIAGKLRPRFRSIQA